MSTRKFAASLAFIAASVLNPGYFAGCAAEDEFQFDGDDMAELLKAANGSYDIVRSGVTFTVEVRVEPGAQPSSARSLFGSPAYACGSRTVYTSAAACVTSTFMPVEGSIKVLEAGRSGPMLRVEGSVQRGTMRVDSNRLSNATVELSFEEGTLTLGTRDTDSFNLLYLGLRDATPMPSTARPAHESAP